MKRNLLLLFLCSVLGSWFSPAAGQTTSGDVDYHLNHNPGDLRVATPNAATFNKYVNNPIDLYSGTARVDIPIYTLKDGAVTIPISLTYATTGIKVSEEASWVGLGWNLSVGGYITRRVVGITDRYCAPSYYEGVIEAYDPSGNRQLTGYDYGGWTAALREAMDWYLFEPAWRKDQNREGRFNPDIFNYSCPDGSGAFVFDWRDNNIYQLDRTQDVKIEKIVTSQTGPGEPITGTHTYLTGFKLTFPNGVTHRFDLKSSMITTDPANLGTQAETYALTQTTYPNGQQVNYTYTTVNSRSFHYGESLKSTVPSSVSGAEIGLECSYSSRNYSNFVGLEVILDKIETPNYQVLFTTSTREDLPDVKKLDRIQVKALATGAVCHDQRFSYSYFTSPSTGGYWSQYVANFSSYRQTSHLLKRLRLDAVYNMDGSTEGERYQFVYNSKALPRKDSYAVDYWGYHNGQTNNQSFIPDLYYLMLNHYDAYLQISNLPRDYGQQLQKALRAYDFESCKAAILTGIQYPTGGYSEIVYEPHRFTGDYIPTVEQCKEKPNDLIETVNIYDNNSFFDPGDLYSGLPKNYQYDFDTDKKVRIVVTVFRGWNSWKDVAKHRAYLYYVENSTEKRIDFSLAEECEERYLNEEVNHTASITTTVVKEFTVTAPAGKWWFIVDYPDELGDQTTGSGTNGRIDMLIEFEKEGAPEVESESEGAGVRVKEVNFYDSPSKQTLLQKTSYEYTQPGNSTTSGVLQSCLQFINYYPQTYEALGKYVTLSNGSQDVVSATHCSDKLEISGSNFFSSPYQTSVNVGYTYVKEKVQGNEQNGYTLYKFHNEEPQTREHTIPLYDPLNGKVQECTVYNASGNQLRKESYVYEAPVYHYYYGFNFYDRINLFSELFMNTEWQCMEMIENYGDLHRPEMVFDHRAFERDAFGNGVARLSMVVHPLNFRNILLKEKTVWEDGVERKETYTYNNTTLQLKSREMTLTPEGTVRIAYTYPNDCPWGVYSNMNNKHFIEPVIEEKKIVGGKLVESVLTEYKKLTDNLFVPSNRYRSQISSGLSSGTNTFSSGGRNTTVYPTAYVTYNEYDSYGNALNLTEGGIEKTYLWSYKGQYPVAEIANATYSAVKSALGSTTPDALSKTALPVRSVLQGLSSKLPNASVKVYEYKSGAGVSQKTEANGENTTYEYDGLNRLKKEKDHNGKTVNDYEYHYK